MIEAQVTKNNKTIGQLKDDYVYLLNNEKDILQDIPLESFVDDENNMDENIEKIEK